MRVSRLFLWSLPSTSSRSPVIAQPRFGWAAIFFFLVVRPTVLVAAFLVIAFFFDVFFRAGRPDSPNAAS